MLQIYSFILNNYMELLETVLAYLMSVYLFLQLLRFRYISVKPMINCQDDIFFWWLRSSGLNWTCLVSRHIFSSGFDFFSTTWSSSISSFTLSDWVISDKPGEGWSSVEGCELVVGSSTTGCTVDGCRMVGCRIPDFWFLGILFFQLSPFN